MNKKILNKYATYEYEILEKFEAGIVLAGDEIKAVRAGRVNLKGSYGKIFYSKKAQPEVFLVGTHFHSTTLDPYRTRKLLLHQDEIKRLIGKTQEKNLTIVPLAIYFKHGKAKVEISLARGKKLHDKREVIKRRDLEREAKQALKNSRK